MDDLPKNKPNNLSAFAGVYPEEDKKPEAPLENMPAVTPSIDKPSSVAFVDNDKSSLTAPDSNLSSEQKPIMSTVADPFSAATLPEVTVSSIDQSSGEIKTESSSVSSISLNSETTPPKPPAKNSFPRLLMAIIFIILLLGVGFVSFRVLGKFFTKKQPLTLTYWGLWEDAEVLNPLLNEYKKNHPNVEIVYTKESPKQYRKRLQSVIERGEGPDIFRFHNTWVPMLKDDLAPAGKTGYTANEFQQTFYPVANQDLVIGGKVLGTPLMIDGLGLYYNEDLFRAAGVTPPASWDELRQAALTLTVKDENQQIVTAGAALGTAGNVEHFSEIIALMMLQNDADLKNPISKEAQDALSFYRGFAEEPNQVWDETLDNSILAFANGKVAMMFAPSWQTFTIKEINPNLKFQIIPVPQLPGTNKTWASYWVEGVSSKSKNIEAAWEFLKFLSSKDSLLSLYTETSKTRLFGEPYSRADLAQTIINDPYVGAYVKQAQTATSFFLADRTFDEGINDRMKQYLTNAVNSLSEGVSAEGALETAALGFKEVLENFGYTQTAP